MKIFAHKNLYIFKKKHRTKNRNGYSGFKSMVIDYKVDKGIRQNRSVTSGEGLALMFRTLSFKGNLTV